MSPRAATQASNDAAEGRLGMKDSLIRFEHERLKEALTSIQSDLASCVTGNEEAAERISGSLKQLTELVLVSTEIKLDASLLAERTESAQTVSSNLTEVTDGIDRLIRKIGSVAEQTKLVALNASIEAARAGEAGRGFSVVADEVKELSQEIKEATVEITGAIKGIDQQSTSLHASLNESCQDARSIVDRIELFHDKLDATSNSANDSGAALKRSNAGVFMVLAKLDHTLWKVNTYLSVINQSPAFPFVDHRNCRLGKWYYQGAGRDNFADTAAFAELEQPHTQVHNGTRAVFDLLDAGLSDENAVALETALQQMEAGSDGVFRVLEQILEQKLG